MPENNYDVIIIGAGPIGLSCAIKAQQNNLSHCIIEKGVLTNSLYHFPTNMTFFSTSQLLEIGEVPFISHGDKPTRREALEYYRRVAQSYKLDIHLYETVESAKPTVDGYRINTNKNSYQTSAVIVTTGFYDTPNMMGIPGEDLPKVHHYYTGPHPYVGQKIVVIGAGNSAADVAIECYLKNADVTMVIREEAFKESLKYWIRPNIENRIREGSITAYFKSSVTSIEEKYITVETPEGVKRLENDFVLAMTGYRPDYSFLKRMGIQIDNDQAKTPHHDPKTFETNQTNMFIAGVASSGLQTGRWFIESARFHADAIFKKLSLGK